MARRAGEVPPREPQPVLVDSSVLVRYLTDDPPELAERAAEAIESDRTLVVSELTLAETAYVLESVYRVPRDLVTDTLVGLLGRRNLRLAELRKPVAAEALGLCRDSRRVSFADALLWALARQRGLPVLTFDERFPTERVEILGR